MTPEHDLCEVVITAPDANWLGALCRELVENRLASSAHVVQDVKSIYRWQGAVHETDEARAFLRSRTSLLEAVVAYVVERTTYRTLRLFRSSVATRPTLTGFERRPLHLRRLPIARRFCREPSTMVPFESSSPSIGPMRSAPNGSNRRGKAATRRLDWGSSRCAAVTRHGQTLAGCCP